MGSGGFLRVPRTYSQLSFNDVNFNHHIKNICTNHRFTPITGPLYTSNYKMELLGESQMKIKDSAFTHVDMEYGRLRQGDISHRMLSLRAKADSVQSNQSHDQTLKNSSRKEAIKKLGTILVDYLMEYEK